MIKQQFKKLLRKSERGQAIILVAFAIIGLVAMVGLVTDTGILLIEYGKLKRGVDAAAVAAAQQYRANVAAADLENAARNFLQLNQSTDITSLAVHSCKHSDPAPPALCNPDPVGHPNNNRKLVEVVASKTVYFGFLRVIGIETTIVTASAVGEAATVDLVLVIDTSASMAFETDTSVGKDPYRSDSTLEDPSVCNTSINMPCQPLRAVKDVALDFLDTLYISADPYNSYDRVAVVIMTSQTPGGDRYPRTALALNSDKDVIRTVINNLKVFEPRDCDGSGDPGTCLEYTGGNFTGTICETYEIAINNPDPAVRAGADPSSCPSSNVGGALDLARRAFTDPTDPDFARLDAFWVVVTLLGGPANTTNPSVSYPNGFCPENTWLPPDPALPFPKSQPQCRDRFPSVRHADNATGLYTNPISGNTSTISLYDADDYARDMADNLATSVSGEGVTIFTIGLGAPIQNTNTVADGEDPPAAALLGYIAECAGDDCGTTINHGQYFFAPDSEALRDIFDRIAQNIATKISQ